MAELALTSVISGCKWFMEQKQTNDEAIGCLRDMGDSIGRMLPVLESLNTQGLEAASGIVANLWQCLDNAKRIYLKYREGFSLRKPWVTPAAIKEKAEYQTKKVRGALDELCLALNVVGHNQCAGMTKPEDTDGETSGIWEIPVLNIKMNLDRMGVPKEVLGEGSFGVVGLGYYTGSTKDGSVVNIPVAIKTVLSNVLSAAKKDSAVLRSFMREVKFLCTLDHPNICDCHGAVTRQDGDLLLWIVMEKLHMNLDTAIMGKHVQHGRDAPGTFVEMLAGLSLAVAYLHSNQRNPIIHRDIKSENVMLTSDNPPVAKLIDFGLAKETRHGVGSTFNQKGTLEWMAPEQKREGGCTTASDVYAIGLIAHFMWSGTRPSDAQATTHVVLTQEQTTHHLAAVTLSVMCKCLNPEARFRPSAAFVSHQLSILKDSSDPPSSPKPGVSEALSNPSLSKKDAVAEFLRNSNLEDYISRVIAYGYDSMAMLDLADEEDVVAMTQDSSIAMKMPHRKVFIKAWKARIQAAAQGVPPQHTPQAAAEEKVAAAEAKVATVGSAGILECQSTMSGHSDWVNSVMWSPDGTKIASGSDDRTVKVWNAQTGQCVSTWAHSGRVEQVEFTHDGATLVSGGGGTISYWDVQSGEAGEEAKRVLEGSMFTSSKGSSCEQKVGNFLITAEDDILRIFKSEGGVTDTDDKDTAPVAFFRAPAPICTVDTSGEHIAVGCENGEVLLLRAAVLLTG